LMSSGGGTPKALKKRQPTTVSLLEPNRQRNLGAYTELNIKRCCKEI
jgi:hypothetical protein